MRERRNWLLAFLLVILGLGTGRLLSPVKLFPPVPATAISGLSNSGGDKALQNQSSRGQKVPQAPQIKALQEETKTRPISHGPSLEDFLSSTRGERLYNFLFDAKYLRSISLNSLLKILEKRFHSPYPDPTGSHNDLRHQETVARLGLLKAIFSHYDWTKLNTSEKRAYIWFHKSVATNKKENLMVQVQAARNLRIWMSSLNHDNRIAEQKDINPHVLALASQTDRQLARSVEAHGD